MKRSLLSGVSSVLSPSKSRLVEAICIHLCRKITGPTTSVEMNGKTTYCSRWKAILQEYQKVRARLFNSHTLIERNKIILYNINETTLRLWFKDQARAEEILTLMQGRETPSSLQIAKDPLPELRGKPANLEGHATPISFKEPEDRSGQAVMRYQIHHRRKRSLQVAPTQPASTLQTNVLLPLPNLSQFAHNFK
jgi:hypothetical protein